MRQVALQPNLPECRQVQLVAWLQGCNASMPRLLDQNSDPHTWHAPLKGMPHVHLPRLPMWPQQPCCYLGLQCCSMGTNIYLCYAAHGSREAALELKELLCRQQPLANNESQYAAMY